MQFEISEQRELKGVPSASGVEVTNSGIYVIGDDSPWIFLLNKNFEVEKKYHLFPKNETGDSIIEKMQKPDLEALTKGNREGTKLYAFGSGSKSPERDVLLEIDLLDSMQVKEHALMDFYSTLRNEANLSAEDLNIEAAEVLEENLFLFNRGKNLILKYSLSEFNNYLIAGGKTPVPIIYEILLPEISSIPSGFSGATVDERTGSIIFTATVEDTQNWIDDGEVLGSFIGVINIKDLGKITAPEFIAIVKEEAYLRIKVESISILTAISDKELEIILVTDSDGGESEFLRGKLTL